jgi:hypothetical protein
LEKLFVPGFHNPGQHLQNSYDICHLPHAWRVVIIVNPLIFVNVDMMGGRDELLFALVPPFIMLYDVKDLCLFRVRTWSQKWISAGILETTGWSRLFSLEGFLVL